jgi:4-hydroxy-tetrahydrodipicolinate synthase
MNNPKKLLLNGIIVPLVTPLLGPDRLDVEALRRLIDHVIEGQVNGIFILGSTGESPSLSHSLHQQVIEAACAYINHRVSVLVGILDTSIAQSAATAKIAANCGADAVVLGAPYYFQISQNDLFEYTQELAQTISLPVCLYNKPDCMKTIFEIETLRKLLSIKNIIGIKDSSADPAYFTRLLALKKDRPDWFVSMGIEQLLADAVTDGADGGVTGGANLLPRLYVDLYHAVKDNNHSKIRQLHTIVTDTAEQLYQPDYLAGLKYALSRKQLCLDMLSEPLHPAGQNQKKQIDQYLQRFIYP